MYLRILWYCWVDAWGAVIYGTEIDVKCSAPLEFNFRIVSAATGFVCDWNIERADWRCARRARLVSYWTMELITLRWNMFYISVFHATDNNNRCIAVRRRTRYVIRNDIGLSIRSIWLPSHCWYKLYTIIFTQANSAFIIAPLLTSLY